MNISDALLLIVTVVVAIWGIYQTYVTKRLEQQIYRLNASLDQSLQILHRAREAVLKIHSAYVFLLQYREFQQNPDDAYKKAFAEKSAYEAELKGIALAIGDKELLDLVNEGYKVMDVSDEKRSLMRDELEIRGQLRHFHTRISQLIESTTKK